ncbi:hypothetical protein [Nocardia sp. CNY236]|uniref:hypothetical protein n=1 Tax=Nocardia sp. CNY236 TaxID=1169152 RepID=UPI0003FF54DF|nr:hypothetical protein [Nocardia sp. CNY236]
MRRAKAARTLANMVDELFVERWPQGNKFATVEVADFVSQRIGRDIDRQYVYRIRTGKVQKVDARILEAIGEFFGKPMTHFSSSSPSTDLDEELEAVLAEGGFQIVGMRSAALTPAAREEVLRLVKSLADVVKEGSVDPEARQ